MVTRLLELTLGSAHPRSSSARGFVSKQAEWLKAAQWHLRSRTPSSISQLQPLRGQIELATPGQTSWLHAEVQWFVSFLPFLLFFGPLCPLSWGP